MKKLLAGLLALDFITTANAEVIKMTKFTKAQEREVEQQLEEGGDSVAFSTNKGILWVHVEAPATDVLLKSKVGECYNITGKDDVIGTKAKKVNCSASAPKKITQKQINVCMDKWTNAYRKEAGADALVRADMLDEWEAWCKAGKQP